MADQKEEEVDFEAIEETKDVVTASTKPGGAHFSSSEMSGFRDFMLKPELNRALQDVGFEHPSEVQQKAIPEAIIGKDILCQAKSGMGKTAVFVMSVLQLLDADDSEGKVRVLVICHARELAYQIHQEFVRFSKYLTNINPGGADKLKVMYIFGGEDRTQQINKLKNVKPVITIGTPGRLVDLVKSNNLDLSGLKFFIIDECDQLLADPDFRRDVQAVYIKTPHDKQVMMFSATMPTEMRLTAKKFMKDPKEIYVDSESKLTLHGLTQYFVKVLEKDKNRKLHEILDDVNFNQVVIFVSQVKRAQFLCKLLKEFDFPAVAIYGRGMEQKERLKVYDDFKAGKGGRILVATDLFGRGIDIERVNVVINYDMTTDTPEKCGTDQYLHRVGRAGRFGTRGLAITFLSTDEEIEVMNQVQTRFEVQVNELTDPKSIPESAYKS